MARTRTPTPSRDLAEYAEAHGYSLAELARMLESDRISISRIVHRRRRPGPELAARIEAVTRIPAASWAQEPRASVAP